MRCPFCNNEMQKGYLQSSRGIIWGPRKKRWSFIASNEDEFTVNYGALFGCFVDGHFCSTCKKIIVEAECSDIVEDDNLEK